MLPDFVSRGPVVLFFIFSSLQDTCIYFMHSVDACDEATVLLFVSRPAFTES